MKKLLSIVIVCILLSSCFTACKIADNYTTPKTPTDVKQETTEAVSDFLVEESTSDEKIANTVESEQESPEDRNEETFVDQETQKQESAIEDASSQISESAVLTKPKEESNNDDSLTSEEIHGDATRDDPTFLSDETFVFWLKNGSDSFVDQRTDFLQQTVNQTFVYYRPANDLSSYGTFNLLECPVLGKRYRYYYSKNDQASIKIGVQCNDSTFEEMYIMAKERFENNQNGYRYMVHDGIEYYYYDAGSSMTLVYWQQFGETQFAHVYQNRDKIEEIIPLLELEQVTVKLNDDAVVK